MLYLPQKDEIVWPQSVQKLRSVPRSAASVAGTLKLDLLFARRLTSSDARALLDVRRAWMPEAMPRRFDTFEPLQGRLERDGEGAFCACSMTFTRSSGSAGARSTAA